jgi:transposase
LLLIAIVHSANIQDRDGGVLLFSTLFGRFPFLKKLFADSAYQGTIFATAIGAILPSLDIEIVKRSDRAKGFVILPKRWIVERSIAWLNRCRRLAKDWENLNRTALAYLHFASIATPKPGAVGGGRCVGGPATAGRLPMGCGAACCGEVAKVRGVRGRRPLLFCIFPAHAVSGSVPKARRRPFRCDRVP